MKKSILQLVMLTIFSLTSNMLMFAQTNASDGNIPVIYPIHPSPTDSVIIYYSYTSNDGCPDYFLQQDTVYNNKVFVSLQKIDQSGKICTQVISKFTAKLLLGTFKVNTEVYYNGKLLNVIKVNCVPDKEGVVVKCNENLFIQEYSPLAIMQLYVIKNTASNTRLKVGDKVKFGGYKIRQDPNIYGSCSVVGEAECITLIENPTPDCIKDRKGIVVNCNRNLYIREITYSKDSTFTPKLFEFENIPYTDAAGVTKPALSLNDMVVFGAYQYDNKNDSNKICPIVGKVKCFDLIYDAPECELNKEGIVVKCNGELFIEEFSMAAVAIKQLYSIKLNSNIVLNEGDRVKFGGYEQRTDSVNANMPCRIIGVALCAIVIQTPPPPPPPCTPDREGVIVACANQLFISETTLLSDSTDVYRLFAFDNSAVTNADGTTKRLSIGDKVKFAAVYIPRDTTRVAECNVVGKAVCIQLNSDTLECVLNRKGKVVTCNNQLFIQEYTITADFRQQYYAFRNNGTFEVLKDGDIVSFGAYMVRPDSATSANTCSIIGIAQCWKVIDSSSECELNRKGVIEQGVDGCTGSLFIREIESRKLFSIALKNTDNASNIAITGLQPGYKVIFGGYLTKRDSNTVSLCYTDGVALCLKVVDTNVGCELNRKGLIVEGNGACANRFFVQDAETGNLYIFYNYDGIYNTDKYMSKLKPGDTVLFGAVERNTYTETTNGCKISGVVLCYELVSSAKTYSISGYALTENQKLSAGRAVLIEKGHRKVMAISKLSDGYFEFKNISASSYTVYVIPAYPENKKFVPTFYIDKLFLKKADFFEVTEDQKNVIVKMKYRENRTGAGKIYGNIHFESENLNDSIIVKNALGETYASADFNIAIDVPVLLLDNKDEPVAWTITDAEGNYVFENVPQGSYRIYSETSTASGDENVDVTSEISVVNVNMVMKSSENNTDVNNFEAIGLQIYPNPVKDRLTIISAKTDIVNIYDTLGQLILSKTIYQGNNEIDVSNLQSGIWILKVENNAVKVFKN